MSSRRWTACRVVVILSCVLSTSFAQEVGAPPGIESAASLPFYEGFESDSTLAPCWTVTGTNYYRSQVTTGWVPNSGSYHLTMDASVVGYSRNEVTLTVDLANCESVSLSFWAKDFSDEAHGPPTIPFTGGSDFDGVAISEDGNMWYEVIGLRDLTDAYAQRTVDLDAAIAQYGLSYDSTFQIRFNQYDNYNVDTDGIAVDDIEITGRIIDNLIIGPPAKWQSAGYTGGPFVPADTTCTLTNLSASLPLTWSAAPEEAWLDVSPVSGSLAPGASTVVDISINSVPNSFLSGVYRGNVAFTNTGTAVVRLLDVELTIEDPPPPPIAPHYPRPRNGQTGVLLDTTLSWNNLNNGGFVYWVDGVVGVIERSLPDGSERETVVDTGQPCRLAIHHGLGKLYWTSYATGSIGRADLDGSNSATILSGLSGPDGIAIDETAGHIYWTEWDSGSICRSNLDGSGSTLVLGGLVSPWGLDLDLANGKLYFTDPSVDRIGRADLDGSALETIATVESPFGIAVDSADSRSYYALQTEGKIIRANLDGSGALELVRSLSEPHGLALDLVSRNVYWADDDDNMIRRVGMDGSGIRTVISSGLIGPTDVTWAPFGVGLPAPQSASSVDRLSAVRAAIAAINERVVEGPSDPEAVVAEDGARDLLALESIASVLTAPERGVKIDSTLHVAVCGANYTDRQTDIQTKLIDTGEFASVSLIYLDSVTPTLAELQAFDSVIVYFNRAYADAVALGDVMADYVDSGGGVVCMVFEVGASVNTSMGGRWEAGDYILMDRASNARQHAYLGAIHEPGHPILNGVSSFDGGPNGAQPATTTVYPGVTLVAEWSNGHPLIATRNVNGSQRVDLAFYPPSADVISGWWNPATDGDLLMANALIYAAGGGVDTRAIYDVYFDTNNPPTTLVATGLTDTTHDPGPLAYSTTYYWRVVATNLSGSTAGPVWAFTTRNPPGEIDVRDSIVPDDDLALPFGPLVLGDSRRETITIHNTAAPPCDLTIYNIGGGGSYSEDFNDGLAQGWEPLIDTRWSVIAQRYIGQAGATDQHLQSTYASQRWQDCYFQATMGRSGYLGSAARLAVRASEDFDDPASAGDSYMVGISGSGSYWVGRSISGVFEFLQSWTSSSYLNYGEVDNVVAINIEGGQIHVYFNGHLAWSGVDMLLSDEGRIGLLGYTGSSSETVHEFDDIVVSAPLAPGDLGQISAEQQWLNENAVEGGSPDVAPSMLASVAHATVETQEVPAAVPRVAASAPFVLENLPVSFPVTLAPGASLSFDAIYQPTSADIDETTVTIESDDDDEPIVGLYLTGSGHVDALAINPVDDFESLGHLGGPFDPTFKDYTLTNVGPAPIQWMAMRTALWLDISLAGGALAPGASEVVRVSLNPSANALPEDIHEAGVIFADLSSGYFETRAARLNVFTAPIMTVTPAAFNLTLHLGQTTTETLIVANAPTADGDLDFTVSSAETSRPPMAAPQEANVSPPRDFTRVNGTAAYAPTRMLVRFDAKLEQAGRESALSVVGATVKREFSIVPGLTVVELTGKASVEEALVALNGTPGVLYAEPNYQLKATAIIPNDPRFDELWGMHNTGQTGGVADADIDAPEAWNSRRGSRNIVVAVIDTGVDYTHSDLTNNMWVNPGEIAGNDIDDDGNGFVDDIYGYDFYNNDGDPKDDHGHGTHCSGTIGGEGDNGIGVAGVCWEVSVMGLKFLSSSGGGSTGDAIECIEYATLMGANVMSNSWGGGSFSQALKDSIDAGGAAEIAFVAASGNDSDNTDTYPHYPSSYDSDCIISVMSTTSTDARSSFSNYGLNSVDLGAPGSSILSCVPGGGYASKSGTSMACPHVAGACALLLSANPSMSVAQVKEALMSTVDETLAGQCASGGRMNIATALRGVGPAWLSVAPDGALGIIAGAGANIGVGVSVAELSPGRYQGVITVESNDPITPVAISTVTLTVVDDDLVVTPVAALMFSGVRGGPFAPGAIDIAVMNAGLNPLNWSLTGVPPWLEATSDAGTLASDAGVTITVSISDFGRFMPTGLHEADLRFTNHVTGAIRRQPVSLDVLPPAPMAIHYFPLDTSPGWTTQGQWEFGAPVGGSGFPSTPHTGANVYGYYLAGAYPNNLPEYFLVSEALDCTGYESLTLQFWRWLGIESSSFDHATIDVSIDGANWTEVWSHTSGTFTDPSWQDVSYPLPASTDNQPSVYIRWGMGPTDGSVTYCGWHIDDIAILGVAGDQLTVDPDQALLASGSQGGPFTPASKVYTLTNSGPADMIWNASADQLWVDVDTTTGVLAPGAFVPITVSINSTANLFGPATYPAAVTFESIASGKSVTRVVMLDVLPPTGEIQIVDSIPGVTDLALPFGQTLYGVARRESVTLNNLDVACPLSIDAIALEGVVGAFRLESLPGVLPTMIAPGASLTFDVVYQPAGPTLDNCQLVVESSDIDEGVIRAHLTGRGVAEIKPAPNSWIAF